MEAVPHTDRRITGLVCEVCGRVGDFYAAYPQEVVLFWHAGYGLVRRLPYESVHYCAIGQWTLLWGK